MIATVAGNGLLITVLVVLAIVALLFYLLRGRH